LDNSSRHSNCSKTGARLGRHDRKAGVVVGRANSERNLVRAITVLLS
jgi:hypothetical protein